jgi:nitrate reductase cytochrome c-type subunit
VKPPRAEFDPAPGLSPRSKRWPASLRTLLAAALLCLLSACSGAAEKGELGHGTVTPEEFRRVRAERRAYDGAPPVIPHAVAALGRENCLSCHQSGSVHNGARVGPPRSHPAWGDCRQCHVEQTATGLFRENGLKALRWPSKGPRQTEISPPMIPHSVQNREQCEVCHIGEQARPVLRASHGPRPNCRQCHAALVER